MRALVFFALSVVTIIDSKAEAAVVFFADRATFDSAAGATSLETFNSYVADASTSPVQFDAGPFTIGIVGIPDPINNRIDVTRTAGSRPVDITPYLLARTNDVNGQVVINFDQSINALGFDTFDYNDLVPSARIFIGDSLYMPAIQPDNANVFYGFVSDTPFNSITFQTSDVRDAFGIDNIAYKTVIAPVTTYLDRDLFAAAVGPTSTEDFNAFLADAPTSPTPLTIGEFTVSVTSGTLPDTRTNRIDVGRAADSRPVDATPYLLARTNGANERRELILDFATPIDAVDFDIADFQDFIDPSTRITIAGQTFVPAIANSDAVSYFGFKSLTPFTQIRIDTLGFSVDAFGIDNLSYRKAAGAVPEPATWAMLVIGFGLCGLQLRNRRPQRA